MTDPERSSLSASAHSHKWVLLRGDGTLGAARRLGEALRAIATDDARVVIVNPGPRWVPEPHMETTLVSVLDADPALDAVVGWWQWTDFPSALSPVPGRSSPATVRVGGRKGDDLSLVDLLARPTSVGPLAIRAGALGRLAGPEGWPADAVLDAASTWVLVALLAGSGARVGSIPRTCSTRTRTLAEDPESLRPIGLGWLTQFALGHIGHSGLGVHGRRELLARWRAAPEITAPVGASA